MRTHFKRVLCLLIITISVVTLFTGCSDKEKSVDFIYPFSADVRSYDPQVASTKDEFLVIENTFEGLVRINDDGEIQNGVAESWNISSDGLVYTFNLSKGIKWNIDTELNSNGERKEDSRLEYMGYDFNPDITAHDFVFALQRAVSPETECPLFSSVSCIKNANKIHSGKMNVSKLGVKAIDDYTLEITLTGKNDGFLNTLTTAVAMPCNKEFFNATKGRYGLTTEYTLFNGQFYLSQILESSYLLKQNKLYTGEHPAKASELTLKISDDNEEDIVEKLKSGYYDAAFISGNDTENINESSGITYTPYNDTTWCFVFNTNNILLQNKNIRNGFCLGLTRLEKTNKEYLKNATCLTPMACTTDNKTTADEIGAVVGKQNIEKSVELWNKGLNEIGETDFSITVITPKSMETYVKQMLQGVQSGIGNIVKNPDGDKVNFTIKVNSLSDEEYYAALSSDDYDIAFCSYKSNSTSASTYLSQFSSVDGVDSEKLEKEIGNADNAIDTETTIKFLKNAEQTIIENYTVYPMLFETSYYASAKSVNGIQFHPGTGRVSFVNADREE